MFSIGEISLDAAPRSFQLMASLGDVVWDFLLNASLERLFLEISRKGSFRAPLALAIVSATERVREDLGGDWRTADD